MYWTSQLSGMNSTRIDFPIHQVMVVKQYAHRLTHYAEKTPKQHIPYHRIRVLILQVLCEQDQWDLQHHSHKTPKLEYMEWNSNA